MGLFDGLGDALKGVLGQAGESALPGLITSVLGRTDLGGLGGIVSKLQEAGLGNQVQSWLGNGVNLPVSADQIRSALGNEQLQQIARHFGLPVDETLKVLSEHLPSTVDQASPNGVLQSDS